MNKLKTVGVAVVLCLYNTLCVSAQGDDAFSAFGAGLSVGSTGVDLELVTSLHPQLMLRGGVSVLPFSFTKNMDAHMVNGEKIPNGVDVDTKVQMVNGKLLLDFYPINSPFFVSGGAYFGGKTVATFEGSSNYDLTWDDFVIPTENGKVKAEVQTNALKPYVSIGYGNAIPTNRIGFRVELGAMFHGTPGVYNTSGVELGDVHLDGSQDISHTLSKWKVYPVLSFRLTGRIF